jgi:hypothetical protein
MHKMVKVVTTGSVGDLGKIARALASANPSFDIAAVGGGEGHVGSGEVGIVTLLIRDDEGRESELLRTIRDTQLDDNRRVHSVDTHDSMVVELSDVPGSLADCCERVGNAGVNIMGVLLMDLDAPKARVGLGFETGGDRDTAVDAVKAFYTVLHPEPGP